MPHPASPARRSVVRVGPDEMEVSTGGAIFGGPGRERLSAAALASESSERLNTGGGIFGGSARKPVSTVTHPAGKMAVVEGLAVPFNAMTVLRYTSRHPDCKPHRIMFRPGAFTDALHSGRNRSALLDHDPARVLAQSWNENLTFWETDAGLMFRFAARSDLAHLAAYRIEAGRLNGVSIGYTAEAFDWRTAPDGEPLLAVSRADWSEVSLLKNPAFPGTYIKVRW